MQGKGCDLQLDFSFLTCETQEARRDALSRPLHVRLDIKNQRYWYRLTSTGRPMGSRESLIVTITYSHPSLRSSCAREKITALLEGKIAPWRVKVWCNEVFVPTHRTYTGAIERFFKEHASEIRCLTFAEDFTMTAASLAPYASRNILTINVSNDANLEPEEFQHLREMFPMVEELSLHFPTTMIAEFFEKLGFVRLPKRLTFRGVFFPANLFDWECMNIMLQSQRDVQAVQFRLSLWTIDALEAAQNLTGKLSGHLPVMLLLEKELLEFSKDEWRAANVTSLELSTNFLTLVLKEEQLKTLGEDIGRAFPLLQEVDLRTFNARQQSLLMEGLTLVHPKIRHALIPRQLLPKVNSQGALW